MTKDEQSGWIDGGQPGEPVTEAGDGRLRAHIATHRVRRVEEDQLIPSIVRRRRRAHREGIGRYGTSLLDDAEPVEIGTQRAQCTSVALDEAAKGGPTRKALETE